MAQKIQHPTLKSLTIIGLPFLAVLTLGVNACSTDEDGDGWSTSAGDCNDGNPDIHPEAGETCDGIDEDCDGITDNDIRCYDSALQGDSYVPPTAVGDTTWANISPASLGWDENALDDLKSFVGSQDSTGFLMLYKGHVLMETYWNGWDIHRSEKIYSAGKSITAFIVGQAQEQGHINIQNQAQSCLGVGWSQATSEEEEQITLRHLLTMTSGLTEELTVEAPPGAEWYYNSEAYYTLQDCLSQVYGVGQNTLATAQLFEPIGMNDSTWVDEDYQIKASVRDMARFGLLIQRNGIWGGAPLLEDVSYFDAMVNPSQDLNPAYGYLWWLNGQSGYELPDGTQGTGYLIPSAPSDLIGALGAADKKIHTSQSMDLVVVRHGPATPESGLGPTAFDVALWDHIMAAAPQ